MNTIRSGTYRWIIFREGDMWFGVALEFNLVVEGGDPRLVELELQEAVLGYLESVKKLESGFRSQQTTGILNQKPDPEYEEKWRKGYQPHADPASSVLSPLSDIYKIGIANLANA